MFSNLVQCVQILAVRHLRVGAPEHAVPLSMAEGSSPAATQALRRSLFLKADRVSVLP